MTTQSETLAFFLPMYNEAGNVGQVGLATIDAFETAGLDYRLAIINDGSSDETAAEAYQLAADNPDRVAVISHPTNLGYGRALRTGLADGIASGRDIVGFMDGDGQFDPRDIERLLGSLHENGSDAAIGIRKQRQDKLHRRVVGQAWKMVSRQVLGCTVSDVDCGFKVFRSQAAARFVDDLISERGGAISPEMIYRGTEAGVRFSEVAVNHLARTVGESSGSKPAVIMRSALDLARIKYDISKHTRTHTAATSVSGINS